MQRNSGIFISIFSLCNGILGASILILPVLALKDGFLLVPFILIFLGFSSGYTAYLLITHAKNHENMHDTVLYHFSNRNYMGIIYNLCIVISMFSSSMIYFSLAVKQVQGLISSNSVWISALLAIILIFLSIVQFYFHLGEKVMGLGAITIIVYLCFLVYAFVVTPSGQNKPVLVGQGTLDLGLSLIMALSCH